MLRFLFTTATVIALAAAGTAGAQFAPTAAGPVTISLSPKNPEPGERVDVELTSYSTNLDSADIAWSVNGRRLSSGTGRTSASVSAGENGDAVRVRAVITTEGGRRVEKSVTVHSATMDLLWEAQTYTPPFYRGKPLFAHQSTVNITAMPDLRRPDGTRYDPDTLIYTWEKARRVDQSQSGYGKRTYTLSGAVISDPVEVHVTASPKGSDITAEERITVVPTEPEVLLYEDHPLYGLRLQRSLGSEDGFALKGAELELAAIPYFFSSASRDSAALEYTWNINDREFESSETGSSATLRRTGEESGSSNISVRVRHGANFMQFGSDDVTVSFGENASGEVSESIFY